MSTAGKAPRGVVFEARHTLDDVPVQTEWQLAKDIDVMRDKRLPVQDDGEEVDWQIMVLQE